MCAAAKGAEVVLRFLAFESGGARGQFELINPGPRPIELFRSLPFVEEGAPFEPGFDTAQYWSKGKWHRIGSQDVGGAREILIVRPGKRLTFTMDLDDLSRVRAGTLVRVKLESADGSIASEPFRWRGIQREPKKAPSSTTAVPDRIKEALKAMPRIPAGADLETAFRVLGFALPDDALQIAYGRFHQVWAQYPIGFGKQFVLECEFDSPAGAPAPGRVHSIALRKLKEVREAGRVYETLLPVWTSERSPAKEVE